MLFRKERRSVMVSALEHCPAGRYVLSNKSQSSAHVASSYGQTAANISGRLGAPEHRTGSKSNVPLPLTLSATCILPGSSKPPLTPPVVKKDVIWSVKICRTHRKERVAKNCIKGRQKIIIIKICCNSVERGHPYYTLDTYIYGDVMARKICANKFPHKSLHPRSWKNAALVKRCQLQSTLCCVGKLLCLDLS